MSGAVAHCWETVSKVALPPEATADMRTFARRLFYAGADTYRGLVDVAANLEPEARAEFDAQLRAELSVFAATMGTELEGKV